MGAFTVPGKGLRKTWGGALSGGEEGRASEGGENKGRQRQGGEAEDGRSAEQGWVA